MSLTSTVFYAFLIAGLLVYYILPAKFRWVWLLIMSYVYYCLSPSQAPFCHYTLRTVTDRPEGTFRSLRYAFGGDHPSQTTHQAMSSYQELEFKQTKGRISTAAPQTLA